MGLENARGQFKRMMEWVFKDTPNIDPYIDDVLIGSTGANMEELVANHLADVLPPKGGVPPKAEKMKKA